MIINKKSAELVGIILGDGSIAIYKSEKYSTYYALKITLSSEEKEYINYVSKLICEVLNEKPIIKPRKKEKAIDIFVFKKNIILNLLDFGLKKAPKWERAIIPDSLINKKYGKYVLRGYFDTDRSVVITKNGNKLYPRLEMKISPSPMQKQFQELLNFYDFNYGTHNIGKGKVRIQMNGLKELNKWKKHIGFSNKKHINKSSRF
ncbi:MAG: hypothetical protein ABIJ18_04465 [archaeon]